MKIGRNAPCHCGSGKKYKMCCLHTDEEARHAVVVMPPEPAARAPQTATLLAVPEPLPHPRIAALTARWEAFAASDYAGQVALFEQTLAEPEFMDDAMAFEMLNKLFPATIAHNERERFAALVDRLRAQRPDLYAEEAHYCLDWLTTNALVGGHYEQVPALVNDMAALAGKEIDQWHRVEAQLAYHGQLTVLVEGMRLAWPHVRGSQAIVPWGIDEFASRAINYELLEYATHTPAPQASDPALLTRLQVYSDDLLPERLQSYLAHFTGQAQRQWTLGDFEFPSPRRRQSRRMWDEEEDNETAEHKTSPSPSTQHFHNLSVEFLGYWYRVEGMSYARGELGRRELVKFILERQAGDLEYHESMLESMERKMARRRGRKAQPVKKFQPYAHPLVPDHERLDRYLGGLLGFLNQLYYHAAALFELLPAWLHFLESRHLIDTALRVQTLRDVEDLIDPLGKVCGNFADDPAPHQALLHWRENAARAVV